MVYAGVLFCLHNNNILLWHLWDHIYDQKLCFVFYASVYDGYIDLRDLSGYALFVQQKYLQ